MESETNAHIHNKNIKEYENGSVKIAVNKNPVHPVCMVFKITGLKMLKILVAICTYHIKNHAPKYRMIFWHLQNLARQRKNGIVFCRLVCSNATQKMQFAYLCFQNLQGKVQNY